MAHHRRILLYKYEDLPPRYKPKQSKHHKHYEYNWVGHEYILSYIYVDMNRNLLLRIQPSTSGAIFIMKFAGQ